MGRVELAVNEIFGTLNPREDITLERLSEKTLEVRKRVEGATEAERREQRWLPYLLPPPEQQGFVLEESGMRLSSPPFESQPLITSSLRRLLDETSDLIDSPSFTQVLTKILDASFAVLVDDKISTQAFKLPSFSATTDRVQEIDVSTKVANTLPVFCKQAHVIGYGDTSGTGSGNEYLAAIDLVKDLEAFAAVVYSSNFEFETPSGDSSKRPSEIAQSETQKAISPVGPSHRSEGAAIRS